MHSAGRQICRFSPVKSEDLIETYRQSGRPEDFEQIVRRFAALVLCECRRVTGNVYDAEDASQLVFLALAMEIKSGTNILAPGAWLKRVSRRQALKIVRSRTRRKKREDAVRRTELHLVDTDSPLDQAVLAGVVRDAIDTLPERYRMAVVLHYFGGMTLELISVELKISKQAVGTRLHRGRKMLAEKLERQGVKLENGAIASALAVLVPAAVVSAIVKSASSVQMPSAVSSLPMTMTAMLRAMAVGAVQRPLRLAVLGIAIAAAGGTLARSAGTFAALRRIAPSSAVRWLQRTLRSDVPKFKPISLSPLSDATDPAENLPKLELRPPDEVLSIPGVQVSSAKPEISVGSNGPLAYSQTQFAVPHSASLGAPILQMPASFNLPKERAVAKDWTQPLRIASRAEDTHVVAPQPTVAAVHDAVDEPKPAPTQIAVTDTTFAVEPEHTVDADEIRINSTTPIGSAAGWGGGAILNNGGRVNAGRLLVGYSGTGAYRQRNNAQLNVGQMLIGVQPQSQGEATIESGTVEIASALQVGVLGTGKLILGSPELPGNIHAASGLEPPVIVRAAPEAKGVIKGWGTIGTGGALINNGQVVADGYGQPRTLDASYFSTVTNTIDNPPDGTNGWYAIDGGRLVLPPIQVQTGTHAYTWGESPTDPVLDLVNSVRFTVHDQPAPASVSISLDSVTISPETNRELPGAQQFGVVSLYQLAGDRFATASGVHFVVRYDRAAAMQTIYSGSESQLKLYGAVDGRWVAADGVVLDSTNNLIAGDFSGSLQYVAVGLPLGSASIDYTIDATNPVFTSSIRPGTFAPPSVPEPTGLGLLVIGGAIAAARRRSRRQ